MQQETFDWTEAEREAARERSIDERWAEWSADHEDVLELFRKFACDLRKAGHTKIGSKLIWERIRWERLTSAHGTELPAMNNDFTSRVSRWLVSVDPTFEGYFEVRRLKT